MGIAPVAGDQVRLSAGCDKRAETCRLKFANFLNFRGFPHLPTEDWLLAPHLAAGART
ncbi:phage BR0599 family protein [Paracoccus cavernae]|uniref:phage BR0599 family protein n=1 Tax=Paracoccus cavernae TaxID=1571207 RepID=UPI0036419340